MEELSLEHRLESMTHQLESFVSIAEEAVAALEQHQVMSQQSRAEETGYFEHQLSEIRQALSQLDDIVANAGLSQVRLAAEGVLDRTKNQLETIETAAARLHTVAQESSERLQRAAENSADWIAEAVQSLEIKKFRDMVFENTSLIQDVTERSEKKIKKWAQRFHLDKFILALLVGVIVSVCMAMFINDEMPWESHSKVIKERDAGQLLLRAWPRLTNYEKQRIEHEGDANYV